MRLFGTKDIKDFIKSFILSRREEFKGIVILDIPAGSGYSTELFLSVGAKVEPYDLFPEFFQVEGMECRFADLSGSLPIHDKHADFILCQEGIEHLPDQFHLFIELNRVLKSQGCLLITTPNVSKLKSRLSHFLSESEAFYKIMPPNEVDSIWFSEKKEDKNIYFGHIFLIGIQKMRVLAKLAGFRIKKIHHFKINHTSLLLLIFFYPFIFLVNFLGYMRADKRSGNNTEKAVYKEIYKLSIDPRLLLDGHLIVEFEKECEAGEVNLQQLNKYSDCKIVT